MFVAAYLLVHGIVKLAIVVALLIGSRLVWPWAIAALSAFLLFQPRKTATAGQALPCSSSRLW